MLDFLTVIDPPPGRFALPGPDEACSTLRDLRVAPDAVEEIVEALPSAQTPEATFVLSRLYEDLYGEREGALWWPTPTPGHDPFSRYFQLYVFLAATSRAREFHAARDISDEVSWETLSTIAYAIEGHRLHRGRPGFDDAFWFGLHFRGSIYKLGRLQFNFWTADIDIPGVERGAPVLGVHIPVDGKLTPLSADDAFARAREFFPRHFPDRGPYRVGTCQSWLLDPQLREYLPETSNILRFQDRFEVSADWREPGDETILRFVFGSVPDSLDALPRDTTLQRAVIKHLESGRHWEIRNGWLEI